MCCGDEPDIHLRGRRRADLFQLTLLYQPQQLHLKLARHLADFVEEEGPPVRQFDFADLVRHGAGERSLHVAEQLGFQQIARNSAAVDCDERFVLPAAVEVNCLRARSSLPVPVSAWIRIVELLCAARTAVSRTDKSASEWPMMFSKPYLRSRLARRVRTS